MTPFGRLVVTGLLLVAGAALLFTYSRVIGI
jgi:hypothetical protein